MALMVSFDGSIVCTMVSFDDSFNGSSMICFDGVLMVCSMISFDVIAISVVKKYSSRWVPLQSRT